MVKFVVYNCHDINKSKPGPTPDMPMQLGWEVAWSWGFLGLPGDSDVQPG